MLDRHVKIYYGHQGIGPLEPYKPRFLVLTSSHRIIYLDARTKRYAGDMRLSGSSHAKLLESGRRFQV